MKYYLVDFCRSCSHGEIADEEWLIRASDLNSLSAYLKVCGFKELKLSKEDEEEKTVKKFIREVNNTNDHWSPYLHEIYISNFNKLPILGSEKWLEKIQPLSNEMYKRVSKGRYKSIWPQAKKERK